MSKICLKYLSIILLVFTLTNCVRREESAVESAQETLLAVVNDEPITQADFELSETWLPEFVRSTDETSSLNASRFEALLNMVLLAQDAKQNHLLSDAETSLLIKEAQAQVWLDNLPLPKLDLSEQTLQNEIAQHPERYTNPAKYTVNYALVHTDLRIQALNAAHALTSGAQMGYNFIDPPIDPDDESQKYNVPRTNNTKGHIQSAAFFNFSFANRFNEKLNETSRLGPFTANDDLLFSCPNAIEVLKNAPLGRPLNKNIACNSDWKAFVIPEWRQDAAPMDDETARLHARQNLIDQTRKQVQTQAILGVNN